VSAGDLDGDGTADVVVSLADGAAQQHVCVLLNQGEGRFTTGQAYGFADIRSIALAQLDEDGRLDVAIIYGGIPGVHIFFTDPQGRLGAPHYFQTGSDSQELRAADLDGDGDLDLALINPLFDKIHWLRNLGGGQFELAPFLGVGDDPVDLVVADLNGDGRVDLATANQGSGDIAIYYGHRTGIFSGLPTYIGSFGSASELVALAAADLDHRGGLDLAVLLAESREVAIIGSGGMQRTPLDVGDVRPSDVQVMDVDGDGWDDLLVAAGSLLVLANDRLGGFAPPVEYRTSVQAERIHVADLNGDSRPDLQLSGPGAQIELLLNIEQQGLVTAGEQAGLGPHLAVGDLDRDGTPEIVAGGPEGLYLLQQEHGRLVAPAAHFVGGSTIRPLLGDLDGDRKLEIVTASAERLVVLRPGPDGRLQEVAAAGLKSSVATIGLAEVDRDGALDVLVTYSGLARTDVLRSSGGGRLEQPQTAFDRRFVLAADFNDDGDLDLVVSEPPDGYAVWAGAGYSFERSTAFGQVGPVQFAGLADFNGDRRRDIYLVSDNAVSILLNESPLAGDTNDDGRVDLSDFAALKRGFGSSGGRARGDFNGDGRVDLADVHLLRARFGQRLN
jgi:hypothetical protein